MKIDKITGEIRAEKCTFGAPYFAWEKTPKRFGLAQGNCNHWECPRCGRMVAAGHYGRIVEGARKLTTEGVHLAFMTVTCRGKELEAKAAFEGYGEWTNRLIDNLRIVAQRGGFGWYYCQVTEKQKRSHPHSHFLISTMPADTVLGLKLSYDPLKGWVEKSALRSDWLEGACVSAGLGEQYDLSEVANVEAASRYVAKYMFKDSQFNTKFPKGWKRVRYSQSWPELAKRETNAFIVMTLLDWAELGSRAVVVDAEQGSACSAARRYLTGAGGVIVHEVSTKK